MSEQQYRLEENNQTNELILWEDAKILNVFKRSYDNRKHLNIIVDRLNKLYEENEQLKGYKKILDYIKKRHNCSNCVKALESNKTMKRYYYCLKHYKEVTENDICENYRYWR